MSDVMPAPATVASDSSATHQSGPVTPNERIELIDSLRGVALLGMLVINVGGILVATPATYDPLLEPVIGIFVTNKFHALFSFLFGVSFALQLLRREQNGAPVAIFFAWRLAVLLGLLTLYYVFLESRPLLFWYVFFGLALIPFRAASPRRIACAMLVLALAAALYPNAASLVERARRADPQRAAQLDARAQQADARDEAFDREWQRVVHDGSYRDLVRLRATAFVEGFPFLEYRHLPRMLLLFLAGLWVVRTGIVTAPPQHARFIRRFIVVAAPVGVAGSVIVALTRAGVLSVPDSTLAVLLLGQTLGHLGNGVILALAYAAIMATLYQRDHWRRVLQPFTWAGRMPLSNYFLQSLIMTTVAFPYGLGLYGSFTRLQGIAFAVAVVALQLGLSRWWLRHFRFGPAEWLWRSLSYGRWQRLRA